ncbi:MAG TPA: succinate dehydrogenase assembly factor 2 [Burkholderiales bacterium]|nr:succinate dehydrogenase assembly factor 2 [Burkholderiales bacterium]
MSATTDHPSEVARRRLRWHCRRGMLENDLVLEHYLHQHADALDVDRLERMNRLLAYDDVTLWELLSGRAICDDAGLQGMVEEIRAA